MTQTDSNTEPAREHLTATDIEIAAVEAVVPAFISQREWNVVRWQIWDTHRAITDLEAKLKPALESIMSGKLSLASMMFGKRT